MDRLMDLPMLTSSVFGEQGKEPTSASTGPAEKDPDPPKPASKSEAVADDPTTKKMNLPPEIESDAYLDDWDMIIHRCQHCQLPFGTLQRLKKHQNQWENGACKSRTSSSQRRQMRKFISRKHTNVEIQSLV